MKNWPTWIPSPGAWMNAILLTLLMGAVAYGVNLTGQLGQFLERNLSSRLGLTFGVLAILSPILVIAVAHHLLHLFLDRFFPDTQFPEMGRTEGIFPGLISWWEGLYGWLVIVLSIMLSIAIIGAFFPSDSSGYAILGYIQMLFSWNRPEHLLSAPTIGRTIIAAYFYQFEYLVRCRLSSRGSNTHSSR